MARYRFPLKNKSAPDTAARTYHDHSHERPSLERDYPRVMMAVQSLWGHQELNTYFNKLTMDERGDRAGFPAEVWEEIYLLLRLHQEIAPELISQPAYRLR